MRCAVLLWNQCEGGRCHLPRCVGFVSIDHFHARMSDAHADSHQYTCADGYLHAHLDGYQDSYSYCSSDTYSDSNGLANTNSHSHSDPDRNSDAYSYSDACIDSDSYSYTNSYACSQHADTSSTLPPSRPHREIRNRKYAGYPHAYADRPYADSHTIWIPNCHSQPCCCYPRSHSHRRFRLEQRGGHTLPERVVLRQL